MARAYLRYAPEGDERPEPLSKPVVERAIEARLDEIKAWLKPRLPTLADADVRFALTSSLKGSGSDAFRAGVLLKEMFRWPVDFDLTLLLRDTIGALALALKVETRIWAVRTGLRFPGKDGDSVEWEDETGKPQHGAIVAVDRDYAAALVRPPDGLTRVHQPMRVFAEHVTANVTQGEYPKVIPFAANGGPA